MMLTREQILSASDSRIETLFIPEWNDSVYIRTITGLERGKFEQEVSDKKTSLSQIRQKLCSLVLCDESGNRLFKDNEVALLDAKNASALDRIFESGQKLNRIGSKDLEDMEKNSGTILQDASISD